MDEVASWKVCSQIACAVNYVDQGQTGVGTCYVIDQFRAHRGVNVLRSFPVIDHDVTLSEAVIIE